MILFIHGYGSSCRTNKFEEISEDDKVCHTVDYDSMDFFETHAYYRELMVRYKPDIVVGHSLGGYWALLMSDFTGVPCIVLNPQLYPNKESLVGYLPLQEEVLDNKSKKFSYLETGDEVIDVEMTKYILEKYTDLEVFEGGHHRLEHPETINKLIDKYKKLDGIYD